MARITKIVNTIDVLGRIWQPGVGPCAMTYTLRDYDVNNIIDYSAGENPLINREGVERWLSMNSGDFSSIIDFRYNITVETNSQTRAYTDFTSEFESEDNECTFWDCMSPSDEFEEVEA